MNSEDRIIITKVTQQMIIANLLDRMSKKLIKELIIRKKMVDLQHANLELHVDQMNKDNAGFTMDKSHLTRLATKMVKKDVILAMLVMIKSAGKISIIQNMISKIMIQTQALSHRKVKEKNAVSI
jgi:hypothetical protein